LDFPELWVFLLAGFADFVAGFALFLFWEFSHDTSSSFVLIVGKRSYAEVVCTGGSDNPMTHAAVPVTGLTKSTTADNKLSLLSAN
jgi:hypothetical protein